MRVRTRIFTARDGVLSPEESAEAAEAAREGRILAFPTDTVYGLGTSGLIPDAARRIYAVKGRDPRKPLPILVDSLEAARRWARFTEAAESLALRFWPGALTLVLEPSPEGRCLLSEGQRSLALRVPAHALVRGLIKASGAPWASTSANLSGEPALRDGLRVVEAFRERVDVIVDAGTTEGVASTVADACGEEVRVLREGRLSRAELESAGVRIE